MRFLELVDEEKYELISVEGKQDGKWILIDLNEIVIHVFLNTERRNV